MSVSYIAPVAYTQSNYEAYQQPKKKSCAGGAIAGATIGAVTGGAIASRSNPYFEKGGSVVEDFARRAYRGFVDKTDAVSKKIFDQSTEILSKIKKTKTVEELKTLFANNKEVAEDFCRRFGVSVDKFLESVTKHNFKENKVLIKNWLEQDIDRQLRPMKNWIQACYNKADKVFEQVASVSDDAYKAIQSAIKKGNFGKIVKSAGVVGAVGALAGWCIHNLAKSIKTANAEH